MGEFIKQLKIENNERVSSIKFINQHLLVAHSDKISILSSKDNFTKRHTFKIGSHKSMNRNNSYEDLDDPTVLDESEYRIN